MGQKKIKKKQITFGCYVQQIGIEGFLNVLIFDILQTNEEFRRTMNGFRMENKPKSGSTYMAPSNIGEC
jgi:hypothetical protein